MRLLTENMRGRSSSGLRTGVEENRTCINRLNVAGTRKAGHPQALVLLCFTIQKFTSAGTDVMGRTEM
jgi:hypothetical protein